MPKGLVTIFGGSGFIGRYTARAFVERGWQVRVACRRVHKSVEVRLAGPPGWVDIVQANVRDPESVARALEGADAVVNLVGILFERGRQTFKASQAAGAATIARLAAERGIKRLVHVSAIASYGQTKSAYARAKQSAEEAVREALPGAVILRPSIVFGPEDAFFNRFAAMASSPVSGFFPVLPAIGGGRTRFQPVFAGDLAAAIAEAAIRPEAAGETYEIGGPQTYSFNALYDFIFRTIDRRRFKLTLPFWLAKSMGYVAGAVWRFVPPMAWGLFGPPPITGDQVELLRHDNVVAPGAKGLADLGITRPASIEVIVPSYLWRFRPQGQFHMPREV